ncbi:MAG: prolipoprotein diacylglyceryl transferase [Planctomycetota bacterium]|jgi:phosphatidylglycerol:prolipoprotein diacylglycerol transferase
MATLLAEAYFHTLDPFAIQFTETFGLRWYGLSYAAGFLIGWFVIRWMAKTSRTPLSVTDAADLIFYLIIGVLIGGRVGYAAFYKPELFIGFTSGFPFWDLLSINKGGMASHGGMIGVIVAVMVFARRRQQSSLHVLDLVAFVAPAGLGLGRLANFVNGELHGKPVPDQANPPAWSMQFPQEMREWTLAQMTDRGLGQVVEQFFDITQAEWHQTLIAASNTSDPENAQRAAGALYGAIDDLIRMAQDGNEAVREALVPILTACYPSQLIQMVTDGPLLALVLVIAWLSPRKPGIIGGWFLVGYGVMRIVSERFREPDVGVAVWAGLSRGQWLSVLLVACGVVGIWIVSRRDVEKMGGLRTTNP